MRGHPFLKWRAALAALALPRISLAARVGPAECPFLCLPVARSGLTLVLRRWLICLHQAAFVLSFLPQGRCRVGFRSELLVCSEYKV